MRAVQPEGPYHLCGWSMGGLIAYEMTRFLRRDGDEVAFLAVVDQGPRATMLGKSPEAVRLIERFGRYPTARDGEIAATEEQLAQLRREPAIAELLPPDLDDAAVDRHLNVYLRNWVALGDYSAAPSGEHMHLFRSEASARADADETLGWSGVARGGVTVRTVPGDHHAMMRYPHVAVLARALRELLEPILRRTGEEVAV